MVTVNYEKKEKVMIVRFEGELMIEEVAKLKEEFNEYSSTTKYFLFDFENLSMIDSSGLGYVVFCLKKLREKEGDLKILNLNSQAKLIFEITRVNSIIDVYANEADALRVFENMENDDESNNSDKQEIIA